MKRTKIPYGKQNITAEDISSVVNVLKSDFLTQGPVIQIFEDEFAKYIGAKFAIAVSNGTAALHLCALAMGLKPGDKVITSPLTFVASANCVRYCGAEVVFCDIDPNTFLLDINEVQRLLTDDTKNEIKGIIPVNFAGRVIDTEKLRDLATEFDCWIIEDACHSPGGYFFDNCGNKVMSGSGKYTDLSIFSFHPVKHIAAGEGGMITTNDESLYKKIKNLRTHGIQQNLDLKTENHGVWHYEMQELGYNYRITDIQAALGLSQLNRAEQGLNRRFEIVQRYNERFQDEVFIKSQPGYIAGHAYHLYVIEVEKRDELINYLREKNIYAQVHYMPVHLMPYYKQFGWKRGDFPVVENYYSNCLSLPLYPTLSDEEQNYVIDTIFNFFKNH